MRNHTTINFSINLLFHNPQFHHELPIISKYFNCKMKTKQILPHRQRKHQESLLITIEAVDGENWKGVCHQKFIKFIVELISWRWCYEECDDGTEGENGKDHSWYFEKIHGQPQHQKRSIQKIEITEIEKMKAWVSSYLHWAPCKS